MDYKKIGIKIPAKAKISGKIKQEPEDFVVQEILADGTVASLEPSHQIPSPRNESPGNITSKIAGDSSRHPPQEYTHFTLVKRDWNQAIILKRIARFCGQSRKRFSYAGTKDKFALTAQRISAWKVSPEKLMQISIKDCKLGDFTDADEKLELGDLWGNRFAIRIRDIKPSATPLTSPNHPPLKQIPNFFGQQRFGMRLNTHIVGKLILQNNIESAIKEYLVGTIDTEMEEGRKAREFLSKNWGDFKEALKLYPRYMRFEKALLNHLVQYPKDYVGAFKQLSKNTYKLFTHAYQSYLFNLELSEKIKKKQSLEGGGNLIGYGTELNEFEKKLIKKEGFKQADFRCNPFPEASVRGGNRKYLAEVRNFKAEKAGKDVILNFDLVKGAYATVLLREIVK